ncbi:MAG: hypothetical protein ABR540_17490 [Acidimicrobiales bacterium]
MVDAAVAEVELEVDTRLPELLFAIVPAGLAVSVILRCTLSDEPAVTTPPVRAAMARSELRVDPPTEGRADAGDVARAGSAVS